MSLKEVNFSNKYIFSLFLSVRYFVRSQEVRYNSPFRALSAAFNDVLNPITLKS